MRILIACEESQEVCKAFRAEGHEAYSCDIQEQSGGKPEWHIRDDVLKHINENWDMMIAHPPCTYLCKAGASRLYGGDHEIKNIERYRKGLEAKEFFMQLWNAPIKRICIENPTPLKIYKLPQWSQVIQPTDFGEEWTKKTCLWLKNLPPLMATEICEARGSWTDYRRDAKARSKTFPGIAKAMAQQWGGY